MSTVFDVHAPYWLKKHEIPAKLRNVIRPYFNHSFSFLDLGTGGGRLVGELNSYFAVSYAVDKSKELLEQGGEEPENEFVKFVHGDFQRKATWSTLPKFDVIASQCAIRKDFCNLTTVNEYVKKHIHRTGIIAFWISGRNDLCDLLDEKQRKALFYDEDEIRRALKGFAISVEFENYQQEFSSTAYVRQFLDRLAIKHSKPIYRHQFNRSFYLVKGYLDLKPSPQWLASHK